MQRQRIYETIVGLDFLLLRGGGGVDLKFLFLPFLPNKKTYVKNIIFPVFYTVKAFFSFILGTNHYLSAGSARVNVGKNLLPLSKDKYFLLTLPLNLKYFLPSKFTYVHVHTCVGIYTHMHIHTWCRLRGRGGGSVNGGCGVEWYERGGG